MKEKIRDTLSKEDLIKRLNIIEGQVRGIKQMISDDRYCGDILIQMSSINKSISSVSTKVLEAHIRGCVVDDIKNDDLAIIEELMILVGRV